LSLHIYKKPLALLAVFHGNLSKFSITKWQQQQWWQQQQPEQAGAHVCRKYGQNYSRKKRGEI